MIGRIRVVVTDLGDGATRLELVCSCTKVGRILALWESRPEAIVELDAEHRRRAPRCRHQRPAP